MLPSVSASLSPLKQQIVSLVHIAVKNSEYNNLPLFDYSFVKFGESGTGSGKYQPHGLIHST